MNNQDHSSTPPNNSGRTRSDMVGDGGESSDRVSSFPSSAGLNFGAVPYERKTSNESSIVSPNDCDTEMKEESENSRDDQSIIAVSNEAEDTDRFDLPINNNYLLDQRNHRRFNSEITPYNDDLFPLPPLRRQYGSDENVRPNSFESQTTQQTYTNPPLLPFLTPTPDERDGMMGLARLGMSPSSVALEMPAWLNIQPFQRSNWGLNRDSRPRSPTRPISEDTEG